MTTSDITRFKHIIINGLPFVRGKSYGQQMKSKIISNLDYYKNWYRFPDWDIGKEFVKNNYMKALEKYFPTGLEEMKGIAAGADISIEEIIMLNSKWEMFGLGTHLNLKNREKPQSCECTGALCLGKATKSGDVLLGMNWDNEKHLVLGDLVIILEVHPDPSENIAPFIMIAEVGQLGRNGMNANRLGVTAMQLYSSEDHSENSLKNGYLPTGLLMRMFIEAPNLAVGINRLLNAPRHASINLMVATGEGEGLNLEITSKQHFISYPSIDKDIITHSNHFTSETFLAKDSIKDRNKMGSSFYRCRRVEKNLMENWQKIDEISFGNAFIDHIGYPNSVCRHLPDSGEEYKSDLLDVCAVAHFVFNLTKKSMRVCRGNPCSGIFIDYKL